FSRDGLAAEYGTFVRPAPSGRRARKLAPRMKKSSLAIVLGPLALCLWGAASAATKPRVLVLTDIENEPDDAMSMVRFLVSSHQWDVGGLVATTSTQQKAGVAPQRIRQIVDAYAKVRDNLEKHEPGFPAADTLRA